MNDSFRAIPSSKPLLEESDTRYAVIDYSHAGDITHGVYDDINEAEDELQRLMGRYRNRMFGVRRMKPPQSTSP